MDHGVKEHKRHNFGLEKFQLPKNKTIEFINKNLSQKNEAKACINNFDETVVA